MKRDELEALIKERMDYLESLLMQEEHLSSPEKVEEAILNVTKFYSALSEDDREYIEYARIAMEKKMRWKPDDDDAA